MNVIVISFTAISATAPIAGVLRGPLLPHRCSRMYFTMFVIPFQFPPIYISFLRCEIILSFCPIASAQPTFLLLYFLLQSSQFSKSHTIDHFWGFDSGRLLGCQALQIFKCSTILFLAILAILSSNLVIGFFHNYGKPRTGKRSLALGCNGPVPAGGWLVDRVGGYQGYSRGPATSLTPPPTPFTGLGIRYIGKLRPVTDLQLQLFIQRS